MVNKRSVVCSLFNGSNLFLQKLLNKNVNLRQNIKVVRSLSLQPRTFRVGVHFDGQS